jgi:hypothetical protein
MIWIIASAPFWLLGATTFVRGVLILIEFVKGEDGSRAVAPLLVSGALLYVAARMVS